MPRHVFTSFIFALCASCGILATTPALAVDGVVLITQAKANAGNVTPGDAAGFPVTLSLPGSYKLAGNLAPGPGRDGIAADAPDIAIDLNGFRMSGGPSGGTNNSRFGIFGRADRLTVKNGTIGGFVSIGIHAPDRPYLIVENMRIINNGGDGIFNAGGAFSRIQNSTVATNGRDGIICGASCQVEGSVVSGNRERGIALTSGTVLGNTIFSNGSYGILAGTVTGFGNNTIINNNNGGIQISGQLRSLYPNVCAPVAC